MTVLSGVINAIAYFYTFCHCASLSLLFISVLDSFIINKRKQITQVNLSIFFEISENIYACPCFEFNITVATMAHIE